MLRAPATLRASRAPDAEPLAELAADEAFELLDVTGATAWGSAPQRGLAGYLPASVLGPPR